MLILLEIPLYFSRILFMACIKFYTRHDTSLGQMLHRAYILLEQIFRILLAFGRSCMQLQMSQAHETINENLPNYYVRMTVLLEYPNHIIDASASNL